MEQTSISSEARAAPSVDSFWQAITVDHEPGACRPRRILDRHVLTAFSLYITVILTVRRAAHWSLDTRSTSITPYRGEEEAIYLIRGSHIIS